MTRPWNGTFISAAKPNDEGTPAVYFRKSFVVEPGLRRAVLEITGLGIVEPYVNGGRVGDDVLSPGWTSYRHRLDVASYDVTELLNPGENAVGAIVGEGWASGRIGYEGKRHHYTDRAALYAQLTLEYFDGRTIVTTDTDFRVGTGAVRANSIYDGETYNAAREVRGWSEAGFDDSGWTTASVFEWSLDALQRPVAPPIRRVEELAPVRILTTPGGRTLVDFGQVLTGWVRITVTGEAGRTVTLRHAELLTPEGEPEYETLRTAQATDRYLLEGSGEPETWEPRFTFHGFRYTEVNGWPGELTADDIRAVVVHSDMVRTGWFTTSDERLDRLHENVLWSMRGNFVGVPTDCPQRDERLGWTGDLNAFAPTAAFLYDVRGVLGSWLRDLAAEQQEKGFVPWVVPDVLSHPSAPTALWSDVAVSLPWALYQEYGDLEILRGSYSSMRAFIAQVEGLLDDNGLWSVGYQFGDWLDPDAPADDASGGKTDRHLVASAYLFKTTCELARTALLLGETEDAERFDRLHRRVTKAFHREYVAPSGRLVGESATAYALAIAFGILEGEQRTRAGQRLAELVAKAGYRISTGFAGTPHVADALTQTGHLDAAYLLLTETELPSFLYPVTIGATTIWERWDSVRPDGTLNSTGMTSLNHYALGAVASWLHRVVGGIARTTPGYKSMEIAPRPGGGLTSAHTIHDTVHGRVEVEWRIHQGVLALNVTIPEGTSARVALPLHPDEAVEQISGGQHTWRYAVDTDGPIEFTMDTPLKEIVGHPLTWRKVSAVFKKHLPYPIDGNAPEAAAMSLNLLMTVIPNPPAALEEDLRKVLQR